MTLRNVSTFVFTDSDALTAAARAAAADPRLARTRLDVHEGGVPAAAEWLATHHSPDVLMVADPVDEEVWSRLEKLADSVEPHCRVVVIGPHDHISTYRDMVSRGVADYLGGPVTPDEIVECIARLFAAEDSLPKGRLVVVTPAVGGAGASTVAAVLAASLAARMGDAVLLDLDLCEGTAALLMGIDPREAVSAALSNPGLDAAMLERFMAREGAVRVLSTAGALRDARALDGETAERLVTVARSMAKVVVVDLPKGWGDGHERLVSLADEVVVVARPDLASLRNCRMVVDDVAGRRVDGRRPRIVLNGVGAARKHEFGVADFTESGGAVPMAAIPFDPEPLQAAVAEGRPVHQAGGKAATALRAFADQILATEGGRAAARAKGGARPLASLKHGLARLVPHRAKKG